MQMRPQSPFPDKVGTNIENTFLYSVDLHTNETL